MLLEDLRRIQRGASIYVPDRFDENKFREETRRLVRATNHDPTRVLRLNRLLLEDTYQNVLLKKPPGWLQRLFQPAFLPMLPLLFVLSAVTLAIGSFCFTTRWLPVREKEVSDWPTNSVIRPERLKGIFLEHPEALLGEVITTNQNWPDWFAGQKWTLRFEFAPPPIAITTTNEVALPMQTNRILTVGTRPVQISPKVTDRNGAVIADSGQKDFSGLWLPILCLVLMLFVAGWRIADFLERNYEDSEDFREALIRWSDKIKENCANPREVKRLLNKIRCYAMIMRAVSPSNGDPPIKESTIVAFGALEDKIQNGQVPEGLSVDEELTKDLDLLKSALSEYAEEFRFLKASVIMSPTGESARH